VNDLGKVVARWKIAPKDTPSGTSLIVNVTRSNRKYSEEIEVTFDGISDHWAEHQALAEKVLSVLNGVIL